MRGREDEFIEEDEDDDDDAPEFPQEWEPRCPT